MGEEMKVLDFHEKSCQLLSDILDDNKHEQRQNLIRTYVEKLQVDEEGSDVPNFEEGWEWLNVEHPLSFESNLKGKVVVLDFFTYCCINCIHILPDLEALEAQYTDTDGVAIVGVHSAKFDNEKVSANILSAVLRYNITHPVVNDVEAKLWHAMGIQCWPTLVIVNPHGRAVLALSGEGHKDILLDFLKELVTFYEQRGEINHDKLLMKLAKDDVTEQILHFPGKITCSSEGKTLAIADTGHHRIILTDSNGIVQTCIGGKDPGFRDGCFKYCRFRSPQGLCFSGTNTIYVADTENHAIRKIDLESGKVTTVAGTGHQGQDFDGGGVGKEQAISSPWDVTIAEEYPNVLLIAMAGTHQIWCLFLSNTVWIKNSFHKKGVCIRFAGSGSEENRNNNYAHRAAFAQPSGLSVGKTSPDTVFVADSESSAVRAVSLKDGAVKGVVGGDIDPMNLFAFGDVDGKATKARLQHPLGVAVIPQQGVVLVADSYNHKIKLVNPITRSCTTVIGSGEPGNHSGLGTDVSGNVLNEPGGLAVHPAGDKVYIADTNNHCIKILNMGSRQLSELPILLMKDVRRDMPDYAKAPKKPSKRLCPLTSARIELEPERVISGQQLHIQLSVVLPSGSAINSEAPSKWALYTEDAEMSSAMNDKSSGRVESGDISSLDLLTVNTPQYTVASRLVLSAECMLYLCGSDDTCYMKSFIIIKPLDVDIPQDGSEVTDAAATIKLTYDLS